MKKVSWFASVWLGALTATVVGASAFAQQAQPAPATGAAAPSPDSGASTSQLQEVVVTANRRSENLQNVPTVVSAFSGAALSRSGVADTSDLSQVVPGLKFNVSNGFAEPFIRGIGTTANSTGLENPVALYVDGVYYATPTGGVFALSSVQNVEVDKGPQGTLFGRNATAGVIQITTRDPTNTPSLDAALSLDNYLTVTPDLYVNTPITSNLATNLDLHITDQVNGYGKNDYPGGTGKDVYKTQELDVRNKYLWRPDQADRVVVTLDYTNLRSSNGVALRYQPGTLPFGYPITPAFNFSNPYNIQALVQPYEVLQQGGISVREEHDFSWAKLTSITAYRQTADHIQFDFGFPPFEIGASESDRFRQLSQELQLSSETPGRLKWTVGAYYFNGTAEVRPYVVEGTLLPAPNVYNATRLTNSGALFGQATYEVLKNTNFTAGLRYTYEVPTIHGVALGQSVTPADQYDGRLTWRFALDHRFNEDLLIYASDNRGFRAGTFNAVIPTQPAILPEQLDSYEVGLKSNLLDRRVRFNAGGFLYEYQNIQVPIYQPSGIIVLNGAKAELYGLDVDLDVRPLRQLLLKGGLELLHSDFISFPNAPINTPLDVFPFGNSGDTTGSVAGNRLPVAPTAIVNLSATYDIPLSAGNLSLSADYNYNSGFYAAADNIARQSAYQKVNAQIGWAPRDSHYEFVIFAKNLTNVAVSSRLGPLQFGVIQSLEPPLLVGGQVKFHY